MIKETKLLDFFFLVLIEPSTSTNVSQRIREVDFEIIFNKV